MIDPHPFTLDRPMNRSMQNAIIVAAIVFGLMIVVPVASFLLRAAIVAGLAGLAVYVLHRMFGGR
jgi:hypothetical protein